MDKDLGYKIGGVIKHSRHLPSLNPSDQITVLSAPLLCLLDLHTGSEPKNESQGLGLQTQYKLLESLTYLISSPLQTYRTNKFNRPN